ncbi:MAG TPA: hypothetical protein VI636_19925 [Candidatus Angelobacter sp.]
MVRFAVAVQLPKIKKTYSIPIPCLFSLGVSHLLSNLPNYQFTQLPNFLMPTRDSVSSGILTKKMLAFVAAWQGDAVAAARTAGYSNPKSSAEKLMSNPTINDAIKKKQDATVEESGRRLGKELNFCRADVLNRMWELANPSSPQTPPSFPTQLKAAQALAGILDSHVTSAAELTRLLQGKTQAEAEFFADHGYFPEPGDQVNEEVNQTKTTDEK